MNTLRSAIAIAIVVAMGLAVSSASLSAQALRGLPAAPELEYSTQMPPGVASPARVPR